MNIEPKTKEEILKLKAFKKDYATKCREYLEGWTKRKSGSPRYVTSQKLQY